MRNYFSHDSNARTDEKILDLRSVLGWEGYGLYWAIVENLREAKEFRLKTNYKAIAMSLGVSEDVVRSIVSDFDLFLFETDDRGVEYFYSGSLRTRMMEAAQKSQLRSEAGKRGAEARWKNANTMAQDGFAIATAIANDGNKIKLKEKKIKETVVVVPKEESTHTEESKGFSFYSLPVEQQNNEQQQIFRIFFFKDFKNPAGEVKKFIEHNEKFGWIPKGGEKPLATTEKRVQWAYGWTVKTQPRTNNPKFLEVWERLFDACARSDPNVAKMMLDVRTTAGKIVGGKNYIRCAECVWRWIEYHRQETHPVLRVLFNQENWSYYNI